MPVRGLAKVRSVACPCALAHDLMRMVKIAPQLLGPGTGASVAAAAVAQEAPEVKEPSPNTPDRPVQALNMTSSSRAGLPITGNRIPSSVACCACCDRILLRL